MNASADNPILAKIRASLGRKATDTARRAAVTDRLQRAPKGVIPKRGQIPHPEQVTLFGEMAERVQATVAYIASAEAAPDAVADYLRSRNLPMKLRMGADKRLTSMNWAAQTQLTIDHGPAIASDEVSLSHAEAGIAESGTLVMTSGSDNPTTLNFLPENHIAVISSRDIVGDYETMWARLREVYGKGVMPRTVNMITGPSRSGDIEQKLLLGAHGPRALHIIVIDD